MWHRRKIKGVKRLALLIGQKTEFFLSSQSGKGFVSFMDDILRFYQRKIFIRGGTDHIRSRIIRNVKIELLDRGYNVEIAHGTLNPDILEGIFVPQLNVALISGGLSWEAEVKDGIINLDQFRDDEKYQIYKSKIHDLYEQINMNLELAWDQLQQIQENFIQKCDQGGELEGRHAIHLAEKILESLFSVDEGRINHRFGQIVTGRGITSYYPQLLTHSSAKYYLNGVKYFSGSGILKLVAREAVLKGITVDVYHNFLEPGLVELIILVDANLALAIRPFGQGFQPLLKYENTPEGNFEEHYLQDGDFLEVEKLLAETQRLYDQSCIFYHETFDFTEISNIEKKLVEKILECQ